MASPVPESRVDDAAHAAEHPESNDATGAKPADDSTADGAETNLPAENKDAAPDAATQEDLEDGEVDTSTAPPLPNEAPPLPDGPPLPSEPVPDDGWDCQFDPGTQAWFFCNRFTGKTQWDNPRVSTATAGAGAVAPAPATASSSSAPQPPTHETPAAGGYNPAIHGDYDPTAWYAQGAAAEEEAEELAAAVTAEADMYAATVAFNRYSGGMQDDDAGPGRHTDDAKARRQMNAYFDADAASAAHDGRSLRAERQSKKPSKAELKAFKEKRKARKEEKRRAWLRD